MSKFQIVCVTMHQTDFSKIKQMNIHSDVVFANQCNRTAYDEVEFEGHMAKMISTTTVGVGINRNLALMYANADIYLFADDDVVYNENVEEIVTSEFDACPYADIIVFNLKADDVARKQKEYFKTRKCKPWEKMPWGACRIAVRSSSLKKANIWFSTLFGGGCIFPSGEDSMWLIEAKRKGLNLYVSKHTIGTVSFSDSTWFTGADERFYFGKGAFYQAVHSKMKYLWMLYFAFRTGKISKISFTERIRMMYHGCKGYIQEKGYENYFRNI